MLDAIVHAAWDASGKIAHSVGIIAYLSAGIGAFSKRLVVTKHVCETRESGGNKRLLLQRWNSFWGIGHGHASRAV